MAIATDYGLDGLRSNPGWDEIFRPSRPALGPTQPPVKWVPGLPGGKVRPGRAADHSPTSSAVVMEEYSYNSTHPLGHTGPVTGYLYLYSLKQHIHNVQPMKERTTNDTTNDTSINNNTDESSSTSSHARYATAVTKELPP